MNYPDCPEARFDCRFVEGSSSCTALHSPLQFNRAGAPVGGGANLVSTAVGCVACGREWLGSQSELQKIQGLPIVWGPEIE